MADSELDRLLAQYAQPPPPTLGGGPPPLPEITLTQPQAPLGQHNLLDRALSSFGQPSLDKLEAAYRGEATPRDVAWEFLTNGPLGPFGMARGPVRIPDPIRAFHGSPHTFDEFRLDKIGTGEGAQAYGHGLYFAESPGVAESYRRALASYPAEAEQFLRRHVGDAPLTPEDISGLQAIASSGGTERQLFYRVPATRNLTAEQRQDILDSYARMERPGRMYEVNIHARPEQFLDWDRPIAQQSDAIQAIYNRHITPRLSTRPVGEHLTDVRIDQGAIGAFPNAQVPDVMANPAAHVPTRGSDFYDELARSSINGDWGAPGEFARVQATRALTDHNIPGIRYLDQGSRRAGDGTRNFVVFDPSLVEVLRRYGMAAPVSASTLLSQYGSPPEQ
jgi:hypothetical protein